MRLHVPSYWYLFIRTHSFESLSLSFSLSLSNNKLGKSRISVSRHCLRIHMTNHFIPCNPLWNDPYWAYTRVMDWWVNGTMTGNSISFVTLLWIYLIKLYSEYTCCIINRATHYRYQLHIEQALMLLFTNADDWFWRLSEFEFDYFLLKLKCALTMSIWCVQPVFG